MATSNKNTKNTKNTTPKTKTFEDYEKEAKESIKGDLNESLKINDETAKAKKDSTNTLYKGYISDAEKSYQDEYRDNSVQKLINERTVAENMANMGLTDSGLNRTQQTAVQLSYANNKASIDRQKQAQVDAIARELAATLNGIEIDRLTNKQSITDNYNQIAKQTATSLYNTDVEAQSAAAEQENKWNMALLKDNRERVKMQNDYNAKIYSADKSYAAKKYAADKSAESKNEKANETKTHVISPKSKLLSKTYEGTLADNGVNVFKKYDTEGNYVWVYNDTKSGETREFSPGQSPHTGGIHDDLYDENGKYDESRSFKANGYQPNNIGGVKLQQAVYKNGENKGKSVLYTVRGVDQKIWKANGKFYIWNKDINDYQEIPKENCSDYA